MKIIEDLENIRSITFLQKYITFLCYSDVGNLGYHFDKHFYGPYSYELNGDLNFLQDEGYIKIDLKNPSHLIIPDINKIE